jgi:hypothetical protein
MLQELKECGMMFLVITRWRTNQHQHQHHKMKLTKDERENLIDSLAYCVQDLKKINLCHRKMRYEDIVRMVRYLDQDDQQTNK